MSHPFRYINDPEARKRLMDKRLVARAYAVGTIKQTGRQLGVGQKAVERALDYHGIRRRKRGEKPPGLGLTRDDVRRAVYRAYARCDRCPPDCVGRARCLDGGARCVLGELGK
jgi:hypothetical protein